MIGETKDMSQKEREYVFEFSGTKEDFLNRLNRFHYRIYGDTKSYDMKDYIIESVNGELRFGVERCGHTGGYWFIPTINETENRIEIRGTIQYIGPEIPKDAGTLLQKIGEAIFIIFSCILLLPFLLLYAFYSLADFLIRKIRKLPPNPKNTEDRLYDLMESRLGCLRK